MFHYLLAIQGTNPTLQETIHMLQFRKAHPDSVRVRTIFFGKHHGPGYWVHYKAAAANSEFFKNYLDHNPEVYVYFDTTIERDKFIDAMKSIGNFAFHPVDHSHYACMRKYFMLRIRKPTQWLLSQCPEVRFVVLPGTPILYL